MTTADPTDAELVTAVRGGSHDAFAALVRRYQQLVCAVAFARTGSVATSEEVAQETFLAAWKNLATLRAPDRLRAWLCATARHLANRRRPAAAPLPDDLACPTAAPDAALVSREEEALVWSALTALPENYREPLVLFYREQRSVREVAAALELPEATVRQRLSRGRELLRSAVRDRVESALTRSRPGVAFTAAVVATLPGLMGTAKAATIAAAATKGATTAGGIGLLAALGGLIGGLGLGAMGARWGYVQAMNVAESDAERAQLRRGMRWLVGLAAGEILGIGLLVALPFIGVRLPWSGWGLALAAMLILFHAAIFGGALWHARKLRAIRRDQRLLRGEDPAEEPDARRRLAIDYRSRRTFLGLPLVHVRVGRQQNGPAVARGWVAFGDVAISPGIALGGVAVGTVALGGAAAGVVSFGGLAVALAFASGGLAVGGIASGGLAAGVLAAGGLALGWFAAFGGRAAAVHYALGGHATAAHANDAAARAVFDESLAWLRILPGLNGWLALGLCALFAAAFAVLIRRSSSGSPMR